MIHAAQRDFYQPGVILVRERKWGTTSGAKGPFSALVGMNSQILSLNGEISSPKEHPALEWTPAGPAAVFAMAERCVQGPSNRLIRHGSAQAVSGPFRGLSHGRWEGAGGTSVAGRVPRARAAR